MMLLAYLFVLTKTAHFLESLVLVVYIVLPRLLMKSAIVNASLNDYTQFIWVNLLKVILLFISAFCNKSVSQGI